MAILTGAQLREKLPLTIGLVGVPFTGKTRSISTLHSYYKKHNLPSAIHILDFDKKADSLIHQADRNGWLDDLFIHRIEVPADQMSIEEVPYRNRMYAEMAIQELNSFNTICAAGSIGAIVTNSYTQLVDWLWDAILANRGAEVGGLVSGARVKVRKGEEGEEIEWTEWRLLREKVIEYIKVMKQFPCDRVFIFHEEWWVEEIRGGDPKHPQITTTGRKLRLPMGGTRKLSSMLGKFFNVMLYARVREEGFSPNTRQVYEWETQPNATIPSAGTSLREGLPAVVEQDFSKVLD